MYYLNRKGYLALTAANVLTCLISHHSQGPHADSGHLLVTAFFIQSGLVLFRSFDLAPGLGKLTALTALSFIFIIPAFIGIAIAAVVRSAPYDKSWRKNIEQSSIPQPTDKQLNYAMDLARKNNTVIPDYCLQSRKALGRYIHHASKSK